MTIKVVKSVGRVFSILELFNRERRSLTASEVARHLGYPNTSTLAILKSMRLLNYFSYDSETRSFMPSPTIPHVVEWVIGNIQQETAILKIMSDLHNEIDETINLSRQTGDFVKIIHGLESTKLLGIRVRAGVVMPLTSSHTGMVALATYPDDEVAQIVLDLQKRDYPDARSISVEKALQEVHTIREQQVSPGYDVLVAGIGIISFPLCSETGGRPFIVAIAGPSDRIRENEAKIIRVARRSINKHKSRLAYPA